jgi:hypothetical protein
MRGELSKAERADERDGDGVTELRINGDAEKDVRLVRHVLAELLHDAFDFDERERFATGDMHEQGLGVVKQAALIDERALERFFDGFGTAILAASFAKAEEAATIRGAQRGGEIVEAEFHEAWRGGDGGDGSQGLGNELIGLGEGFLNAVFGQDELTHAVVFKEDERIAALLEQFERFLRLADAAAAFKAEGHGGYDDDEGTGVLGDLRDDGAAPLPVPPPRPALMKMMSCPSMDWRICSRE